jgi:hypothetical protein
MQKRVVKSYFHVCVRTERHSPLMRQTANRQTLAPTHVHPWTSSSVKLVMLDTHLMPIKHIVKKILWRAFVKMVRRPKQNVQDHMHH